MFSLLGWLHALAFRFCVWLLKLPFQAVASTIRALLALLGEELRRWLSVVMAGLMVWVIARAALKFASGVPAVMLVVALMAALWFYGLLRAAHYTWTNNLVRVRQRQYFKQLVGQQAELGDRLQAMRGEVVQGVARRARGTVAESVFQSNRAKRAEEQAAAEATAERAERERAAAAAWDQAVAAKRAERERFAAEAAQRWTNRQQEGA